MFSGQTILKFFTEHGSVTAVLCAKFQSDSTTEMDVLYEQDFALFVFYEFRKDILYCKSPQGPTTFNCIIIGFPTPPD